MASSLSFSATFPGSNVSSLRNSYEVENNQIDEFELFDISSSLDSEEVNYGSFKESYIRFYGKRLAEAVETHYGPYDNETITVKEIKQRSISAAALANKDDLRNLYDAIQADIDTPYCISLLSVEELEEIRQNTDFEELTHKHIEILMSAYRCFPNSDGNLQCIGSLFFPLRQMPKIPLENKLFYKHLTMIRAFERSDHFVQNRNKKNFAFKQKLAASEHMCREIAYGVPLNNDLENAINLIKKKKLATPGEIKHSIEELVEKEVVGTIFPTLNEKGEKVFFEIKGSVFEDGLVAFICGPLTDGQWKVDEDSSYPLKIVFRGTWCASSLKRDLTEGVEIGQNSFFGLSPTIIERLEASIPEKVENVAAEIGGHSLGGVDASRLVVLLAKLRVERIAELGEGHESALDKIRSVNLTTWNSPGVHKRTCRGYNENRAAIKEHGVLPLSFRHTHVQVEEDVFQNLGKAMLGWVDPKNKSKKTIHNSHTTFVKFTFKKSHTVIGTTWFAHRLPCLSVEAKKNTMKVRRGKINHRLGPRSAFSWVKLIAKAVFRRTRRIPIAMYRVIIKEKKKDYHDRYTALAVKQGLFN